jgi:hypothetical protein
MKFNNLTDEELIRHAYLAQNDLTTTDLESVVVGRLEEVLAENTLYAGVIEVLDEFDVNVHTTAGIENLRAGLQFYADFPDGRALLEVLAQFDVFMPDNLHKRLERLNKFDQVMEDLTDPLTTLQSLVTT